MASRGDEIAIRVDKRPLLVQHKQRIEDSFSVSIELDLLSKDGTQWLLVKGEPQNKKVAKDYVRSLCNPAENIMMPYPPHVESLIKNATVHRKLEKQSNAVILFSDPGILNIMGSDSLSVTLAMSAVEELINKYLNTEQSDVDTEVHSPVSNLSSIRLDQELRRLSSNHYVMDEDYSHTNDAVKRTILSWMNDSIQDEDGTPKEVEADTTAAAVVTGRGQSKQQTGVGGHHDFKTPSDFNSNSKFLTEGAIATVGLSTQQQQPPYDSPISVRSSSSSDIQLLETPPRRKASSELELLSPEVFVATPRVSQSVSTSSVPSKTPTAHEFTSKIPLTVAQLENRDNSKPVNHEQQPRFGLTQQQVSRTRANEASSGSNSSDITVVGEMPPSEVVYGEDYLLAQGLQHDFQESDIQSVFTRFGTNMRLRDFLREVNVTKSDNERKRMDAAKGSSSSSGGGAKSTAIKNFEFPKAPSVTEITTNQMLKPEILKDKSHMDEYFSQLTKDFVEETSGCDRDELKMRNFERQRLLREAYSKQLELGSTTTDAQTVENKEPETTETENMELDELRDIENKKRKHDYKGAKPRKCRWSPSEEKNDFGNMRISSNETTRQSPELAPQNNNPVSNKIEVPQTYTRESTAATRTHFQSHSPRGGGGGKNGNPQHWGGGATGYPHGRNLQDKRSPSPGMRNRGKQFVTNEDRLTGGNQFEKQQKPAPSKPLRSNLRYVVIDGSNVAFHHGNHQVFSCKGIEIVINYFLKRGHTEVTAFVPQWRTRTVQSVPVEDQHLLEDLRIKGNLVYTPCRKVAGKNIRAHDDNFVIRLAAETEGIVVSNDNFRDHYKEKVEWRDVIENRLLMYSFVGNFFMPAEDPLGPAGPNLDQFLLKDTVLDIYRNNIDRPRDTHITQGGSPRGDRSRYQDNHHSKPMGGYVNKSQGGGGGPNRSQQQQQTGGASHTRQPATASQSWVTVTKQNPGQQQQGNRKQNPGKGGNPSVKKGGQHAAGNMTWQQQHLMQDKQQNGQNTKQQQQQNTANTKYPGNQAQSRMNNGGMGSSPTENSLRSKSQLAELYQELCKIFPSDIDKVERVLQNHPEETDLNKLSLCIVEIM